MLGNGLVVGNKIKIIFVELCVLGNTRKLWEILPLWILPVATKVQCVVIIKHSQRTWLSSTFGKRYDRCCEVTRSHILCRLLLHGMNETSFNEGHFTLLTERRNKLLNIIKPLMTFMADTFNILWEIWAELQKDVFHKSFQLLLFFLNFHFHYYHFMYYTISNRKIKYLFIKYWFVLNIVKIRCLSLIKYKFTASLKNIRTESEDYRISGCVLTGILLQSRSDFPVA